MKLKKILAFLLTMALLVSSVATGIIPVSAETTDALDVWDGTIATEYAGGSGTFTDPYLISTPEQLALMATGTIYTPASTDTGLSKIEKKYYKLLNDIYLNDTNDVNWRENNPNVWIKGKMDSKYFFTGNFDGSGHTIKGIYVDGNYERVGLFPGITNNGGTYTVSIKNVTISDSYMCSTASYVSVFAGFAYKTLTKATFENCYIYDTVTVKGKTCVGGFIGGGVCDTILFRNCASFANITATDSKYGSFIGGFNAGDSSSAGNRKVTYNNCIASQVYTSYGTCYPTFTNSYCAVEGSATANKNTPSVVSLENMVGEAAKTNMPALSWNVWSTTEKYPVLDLNKEDFVYSFEDWTGGTQDKNATGVAVSSDFAKDGEKSD